MNRNESNKGGMWSVLTWVIVGIVGFEIAYHSERAWFLALLLPLALIRIAELRLPASAFRVAFGMGMVIYGAELLFYHNIFSYGAVALWAVLALWLGLFAVLLSAGFRSHRRELVLALAPFVWTGIEFARSELYPLRFTWVIPGFAVDPTGSGQFLGWLGVYGIGFVLAVIAALFWWARPALRVRFSVLVAVILILVETATDRLASVEQQETGLNVAGIHLVEGVTVERIAQLDGLLERHPDTELVVVGEYTFAGEPEPEFLEWCRENEMHLVAGGMERVKGAGEFNTAFVIGPDGEVVFKQAKSVPIQFFDDGLPARKQELWDSPWGKIGVAICYDLSYRQVMDRLVRQGARLLVIPTLDELSWGEQEHRQHARVAPMRAAEYKLSIARVGSSGISQLVAPGGLVIDQTRFPGPPDEVAGVLPVAPAGRIPIDFILAPVCSGIAGLIVLRLLFITSLNLIRNRRHARASHSRS